MMFRLLLICFALVLPTASQQIQDIWTTSSDKQSLLKYQRPSPISFTNSASAATTIAVDASKTHQQMIGFGGSMTDSSAKLLSGLKSTNSGKYWELLNHMFNSTDGANSAGMTYLRVPLGASDFSDKFYTYDETQGDQSLAQFDVDTAPSYLFKVIEDIQTINSVLKVHLCPWSPPSWMKDSGKIGGGKFTSSYTKTYAQYLLKSLQGFQKKGIRAYAISIQNEPQNENDSYPTALIPASYEAKIGRELRALMDANGFKDTVIVAYEHNWDNAGSYPVEVMQDAGDSFAGAAFHCYAGSVSDQDNFHNAYPAKDIYFTECTGMLNGDWWSDLQWYMNNIFIGSVNHNSKNGAMWNLVLDGQGQPLLPGTTSCGGGNPCRGVVTLNGDGSYTLNQEFYAIAQASKAVIPRDRNGPFGQRIGSTVSGGDSLIVTAYETKRASATDEARYSLVVLNQGQSLSAAISFNGKSAQYQFPAGVTTLWWYA